MAILLFHETGTDAHLATPSRLGGGEAYPPRYYQAVGHFLELESTYVAELDAVDICKIPGWRYATAQEQNQWTAQKRKAARLVEAAPAAEAALPAPEPAPAAQEAEAPAAAVSPAPEEPPAPAPQPSTMTTVTAPKSAAGKDN